MNAMVLIPYDHDLKFNLSIFGPLSFSFHVNRGTQRAKGLSKCYRFSKMLNGKSGIATQ